MLLRYASSRFDQELIFSHDVVAQLWSHRQNRAYDKESGGQLFARFCTECVEVVAISEPQKADRRTRTSFQPDRAREQVSINDMFRRGLHYIGDWHTHPEPIPSPSAVDRENIQDIFQRSDHDLLKFVLVIVGGAAPPSGFTVMVCDDQEFITLELVGCDDW